MEIDGIFEPIPWGKPLGIPGIDLPIHAKFTMSVSKTADYRCPCGLHVWQET